MKKSFYLIIILSLFVSCGPKQEEVERITEDGVEVVINHSEPYEIQGEPRVLHLEHEFSVDTEKEEIAKLGLTDVSYFSVDSEGNIYIGQFPRSGEHLIYKFSHNGDFLISFGEIGDGPGEVQWPSYQRINSRNEIPIFDSGARKILLFDKNGALISEITNIEIKQHIQGGLKILDNGNFIVHMGEENALQNTAEITINLYDSAFKKLKELGRYEIPLDPMSAEKVSLFPEIATYCYSEKYIYLGNVANDNEIMVFDLGGSLKIKIRKEYKQVKLPEGLKETVLNKLANHPLRQKLHFPAFMPIYQYFFTDDNDRLYVMTSEKDVETGQYIFDIFNRRGVFMSRKNLGYFDLLKHVWEGVTLDIVSKGERLYCLREKESGYKELVVYKMTWE